MTDYTPDWRILPMLVIGVLAALLAIPALGMMMEQWTDFLDGDKRK